MVLLEMGADDHLPSGVSMRELAARVRAILRRTSLPGDKLLTAGEVSIDTDRRRVTRKGAELTMTAIGYNLLRYLLHNADRPLTREVILNAVWGYSSYPNTRTVDAHIVRLRQKVEPTPSTPRHILTIHGVGYRFLP